MITKTATGVEIEGRLVYDPQVKQAGSKDVYKMVVRAFSTRHEDGQYENTDVECCMWSDFDWLDGMLFKGDHVKVYAREIKSRESNGKLYRSVNVDSLYPEAKVIFRWNQEAINVMCDAMPQEKTQPEQWPQTDEAKLNAEPSTQERSYSEDEARIIESDEDDLPF